VHEFVLVRVVEGCGHRDADVHRQVGTQALLVVEQLSQALAVDELHHDGLTRAVVDLLLERVVDGHDVGMAQLRNGPGLAAETLGEHGVGGQRRLEQLDGDLPVELDVGRDPHLGHASLGKLALQAIALGEDG